MQTQKPNSNSIRMPFEMSGIESLEPMVLLSACGLNSDIQNIDYSAEKCDVESVCADSYASYDDVSACGGKSTYSNLIDIDSCQTQDKFVQKPYSAKGGCGSAVPVDPCDAKVNGDQFVVQKFNDGKFGNAKSLGCGSNNAGKYATTNFYDASSGDASGVSSVYGNQLPSANPNGIADSTSLIGLDSSQSDLSFVGDTLTQSQIASILESLDFSVNASAEASITISGLDTSTITIVASADTSATADSSADASVTADSNVTVEVVSDGTTVEVNADASSTSTSSNADGNSTATSDVDVGTDVSTTDETDNSDVDVIPPTNDEDLTSVADGEFRSIDGSGNNLIDPQLGAANTELIRLVPGDATQSDPVDGVLGVGLPSPREVSNIVNDQAVSVENERGTSDFLWAFGQFLDHDITLTEAGAVNGEKAPIAVPIGDPEFDPRGTGAATIDFTRSDYEIDENGVRQFENEITAFIDGSQVYGSDDETAALLRDSVGGKLLVSEGNLLPFGVTSGEAIDDVGGQSFIAGDVRANENAALTSLHTLFVREHNRLADEIAATEYAGADLTDPVISEQIYQSARELVSAQLQHITYDEFLPALLGNDAIGEYQGYDPNVDPAIANEFSTAAFRIGHTMLSSEILRLDENGNEIAEGNLQLRDAFFRPDKVVEAGIDPILRGLSAQTSQEVDPFIIDDVRNFLFGPPGSGGLDLASLNIQRGRDHGLPSYVDARAALGLPEICDFTDISSDPEVVSRLQEAYGTVDKIDFWVGGLAEDHVPGSSTGALFANVMVDQFTRLRDGDRFYFENSLSESEIEWVQGRKLSDVIRDNTSVENIADNVFFVENNHNRYV